MSIHGSITRTALLLTIGLATLASAAARGDTRKGADYFYGGIRAANSAGRLCLFFYAARSRFASPTPDLGRRVLVAISSNATELDNLVSLSHVLTDDSTIDGHATKTMLRAGVFPSPTTTIGVKPLESPDPVRFQPAGIRSIRDLRKRFGASSDREQWSGDVPEQLGLSGIVEWWGSTGVHVAADGMITHVLIRVNAQGK